MGIYYGQMENPCPRCGGVVKTTFITVGGMAFYQWCEKCEAWDFTDDERKALGSNGPARIQEEE